MTLPGTIWLNTSEEIVYMRDFLNEGWIEICTFGEYRKDKNLRERLAMRSFYRELEVNEEEIA